jgi:hypothetical protein
MWFRPRCPIDAEAKAWMEGRMRWLAQQFGLDRMLQVPVVLPTAEFFPDSFQGTEHDAQALMQRVCDYMGVDPVRIRLGFYSEQGPDLGEQFRPEGYSQGTAGLYQGGRRNRIWIEESQLTDPIALVATFAHELGHVHLLGDGRVNGDEEDHEPLTDLLTVFLGLGVFTANSYLRERRETGAQYSSWSLSRQGYLSAPMYGYALALFAWAREELRPAWADVLRPDVRTPFTQGFRYLTRTGDSAFRGE